MEKFALLIAGALLVGCSEQNADTTSNAGVKGGYTMNEPAGGSNQTNRAPASTFSGQEGGSASSAAGQSPSGSSSPGPAAKTQRDNSQAKPGANP